MPPVSVRNQEYSHLLEQVKTALGECAALDETICLAEAGAKQATINGYNFIAPMEMLVEYIPLCRFLSTRSDRLDGLPSQSLRTLHGAASSIIGGVKAIREFTQSVGVSQVVPFDETPMGRLARKEHDWPAPILEATSFVNRASDDLGTLREHLEEEALNLERQTAELGSLKAQARSALEEAKEAALRRGVSEQGKEFLDAKETYATEAGKWETRATYCAVALSLLAAYSIFFSEGPPLRKEGWTAAANLGYFGARLLLVTVASFLLVVCVRNYRGFKHNEVLNAHRARALATFSQFRAGAEAGVVEAVTLHATEAVFSVQASGFVEGESVGTTHVAELLAAVQPKNVPR